MALNKIEGEELAGRGRGTVAPVEKWVGVLGMLETAAQNAAAAFRKSGAPQDIAFTEENVSVQEFHMFGEVVFLFQMTIKGEVHFYPYTFKLGPEVIAELAVAGKWPVIYAMPADARAN